MDEFRNFFAIMGRSIDEFNDLKNENIRLKKFLISAAFANNGALPLENYPGSFDWEFFKKIPFYFMRNEAGEMEVFFEKPLFEYEQIRSMDDLLKIEL